jgi:hypothetical protein
LLPLLSPTLCLSSATVFGVCAQYTSGYSACTGRPLRVRARYRRAHATPGVAAGLQVRSADSLSHQPSLSPNTGQARPRNPRPPRLGERGPFRCWAPFAATAAVLILSCAPRVCHHSARTRQSSRPSGSSGR